MRQADIAIIGGGLAGSVAAAMLGRAGIGVVLVDPHETCRPDFRCEKLDAAQLRLLDRTGLTAAVLAAATPVPAVWVTRYGRLVRRRRNDQHGILYRDLVDAVRAAIPGRVALIRDKVSALATGPGRQTVTLAGGGSLSARLVVLATGLNHHLRGSLGIARRVIAPHFSTAIGFDLAPRGRRGFAFPALTAWPEAVSGRLAFVTFFPIGAGMRANIFGYWDPDDPWLAGFRADPAAALFAALPHLRRITGDFDVSDVRIRPIDLYQAEDCDRPGVVLVGDAFSTSCPAAGTGVNKVLTDVERLCNVHIPAWLSTEGMGEEKLRAFYADPVKLESDRHSARRAAFIRAMSLDRGPSWRARRLARFLWQAGLGTLDGCETARQPMNRTPGRPTFSSGIGV